LFNRVVNNQFAACSKAASLWLHGKNHNNKANIIINAIDTEKFSFDEETRINYRKKYNIKDEIVIGHVGRFHYQKNHDFMLLIAKGLNERKMDFKMIFVGSGELKESLELKIEDHNLNSNVILVGKTDVPEAYYNMFDIFILPSIFEGLGISLVEAQSNGLPCIVSNSIPEEAIFKGNTNVLPIVDYSVWIDSIQKSELTRTNDSSNPFNIKKSVFTLIDYYLSMDQ
jgi:glycosyltransferase EpsF